MHRTAIVTDSTADLPVEMYEANGITVVPLTLIIGDETMPDGTLTQAEFFERMNAAPELPTTSQPPVGVFVDVYRKALETASEVVSIHISSKLSGTIASAVRAAEEFAGKVHVIDSKNLSGGLGFQVLEGARAAAEGIEVAEIVKRVEDVKDRVGLLVHLDTIENLAKGGRIPPLAGRLGSMLNVKLSITVGEDGAFAVVRPFRNAKTALSQGLDWIEAHMGGSTRGAFCVMHAMAEERAEWLRDALSERFDVTESYTVPTGSVIATHTGTGWGVAFVPEK